jgi:hypothetical protein
MTLLTFLALDSCLRTPHRIWWNRTLNQLILTEDIDHIVQEWDCQTLVNESCPAFRDSCNAEQPPCICKHQSLVWTLTELISVFYATPVPVLKLLREPALVVWRQSFTNTFTFKMSVQDGFQRCQIWYEPPLCVLLRPYWHNDTMILVFPYQSEGSGERGKNYRYLITNMNLSGLLVTFCS